MMKTTRLIRRAESWLAGRCRRTRWLRRRPCHRLIADFAQRQARVHVRTDVDPLPARVRDLHDACGWTAGVHDLWIERIGHDVAELVARRRQPVERRDRAQ